MKSIQTKMQTVDMQSGKVTKTEFVPMHVLPPRAGLCAIRGARQGTWRRRRSVGDSKGSATWCYAPAG